MMDVLALLSTNQNAWDQRKEQLEKKGQRHQLEVQMQILCWPKGRERKEEEESDFAFFS